MKSQSSNSLLQSWLGDLFLSYKDTLGTARRVGGRGTKNTRARKNRMKQVVKK